MDGGTVLGNSAETESRLGHPVLERGRSEIR
jgi:hypothetical protein